MTGGKRLSFPPRKILVLAGLLLLAACEPQERNPGDIQILSARAVPVDPTNPLGGAVPDRITIEARAVEPGRPRLHPGDWFFASLEAGTATDPTRYGGATNLRFTVTAPPTVVTSYPGPLAVEETIYPARSDGIAVLCGAEGGLRVTRTGQAADDMVFRIRTAGMTDPVVILQDGHPSLRYTCAPGPRP